VEGAGRAGQYKHSGRDAIDDFQITKNFLIQKSSVGFSPGSIFYVKRVRIVDNFLR
jgi:hypothetical protein